MISSRYLPYLMMLVLWALLAAQMALAAPGNAEIEQKKTLILKLYEAVPVRELIDASISSVAAARYPEGVEREDFTSRLQLAVDYDKMETLSTQVMTALFTVPELQAMVDYYTSDLGRAAEKKIVDYRSKMAPELKKMLDAAILDARTTPTPADAVLQGH